MKALANCLERVRRLATSRGAYALPPSVEDRLIQLSKDRRRALDRVREIPANELDAAEATVRAYLAATNAELAKVEQMAAPLRIAAPIRNTVAEAQDGTVVPPSGGPPTPAEAQDGSRPATMVDGPLSLGLLDTLTSEQQEQKKQQPSLTPKPAPTVEQPAPAPPPIAGSGSVSPRDLARVDFRAKTQRHIRDGGKNDPYGEVGAKQEILHSIVLPEGWTISDYSDFHTKWGSAYYQLRDPDGESLKIRIGDHPAGSRGRENDRKFSVPKDATLQQWADAAERVQDFIWEQYGPDENATPVSEGGVESSTKPESAAAPTRTEDDRMADRATGATSDSSESSAQGLGDVKSKLTHYPIAPTPPTVAEAAPVPPPPIASAPRATGRAQPGSEMIRTSNGIHGSGPIARRMDSLEVDGSLAAPDGSIQRIERIFPQGKQPVFKVTLTDPEHASDPSSLMRQSGSDHPSSFRSSRFTDDHLCVVRLDSPTGQERTVRLRTIRDYHAAGRAVFFPVTP